MKRTFTINISGSVFHIEEDAYEVLQKYLVKLKTYFGNQDEGKEIMADIEARIAEICSSESANGKNLITLELVNEVIKTMGTPESISEETEENETFTAETKSKKRLYRDPEHRVLSGVCGGLAAYFDMDVAIMRIIFVLITFVSAGVGIFAYLILWIAVPKATNTAQRLEMRGQKVSVKNIEKFIRDEADAIKDSYNEFRKSGVFSKG
jgi:phage shock protein PspC (stress-responsive transcriptional regulator)